jgi:hypothetical protein
MRIACALNPLDRIAQFVRAAYLFVKILRRPHASTSADVRHTKLDRHGFARVHRGAGHDRTRQYGARPDRRRDSYRLPGAHGRDPLRANPLDRIAQLVMVSVVQAEFKVVADFEASERGQGGFGSRGAR